LPDKMKIGMISFAHGHAGSYLQHLLKMPEVELAGIADHDFERVRRWVEPHEIPYYADYRDMLRLPIDAVVICSENVLHAQYTIDAARAGKHVLCEKPLGVSEREMKDMIAACADQGVRLMTAFPCRYIPAVAEAREAVRRGDIGRLVAFKGWNRGSGPGGWFVRPELSGGGAILDHTVHVMDLMHWITGSRVSSVYAESGTMFRPLEVEDAGLVHVTFDSGVIAVLDTSWSRCKSYPTWGDVALDIIGTDGVISLHYEAQKNELYSDDAMKTIWSYWGDDMDGLMMEAFVRALKEGGDMPITGEDGMYAAQVALGAYESVRQGRTVRLSLE